VGEPHTPCGGHSNQHQKNVVTFCLTGGYSVTTLTCVEVTFSATKVARNRRKHGISLSRAKDFDFDTPLYIVDDSQDYGEIRIIAIGFIGATLHVLVFSPRGEDAIRAIMLRKADHREMRKYDEET